MAQLVAHHLEVATSRSWPLHLFPGPLAMLGGTMAPAVAIDLGLEEQQPAGATAALRAGCAGALESLAALLRTDPGAAPAGPSPSPGLPLAAVLPAVPVPGMAADGPARNGAPDLPGATRTRQEGDPAAAGASPQAEVHPAADGIVPCAPAPQSGTDSVDADPSAPSSPVRAEVGPIPNGDGLQPEAPGSWATDPSGGTAPPAPMQVGAETGQQPAAPAGNATHHAEDAPTAPQAGGSAPGTDPVAGGGDGPSPDTADEVAGPPPGASTHSAGGGDGGRPPAGNDAIAPAGLSPASADGDRPDTGEDAAPSGTTSPEAPLPPNRPAPGAPTWQDVLVDPEEAPPQR